MFRSFESLPLISDAPFAGRFFSGLRGIQAQLSFDLHRNVIVTQSGRFARMNLMRRAMHGPDPDIASTAALIGDSSRALILSALASGCPLPAGELARLARISPQTASNHLDKLFKGNLLSVEIHGRHHYYRLRDSR